MRLALLVTALVGTICLATQPALVQAETPIAPADGAYKATGQGDPAAYTIQAQVKRKAGRRTISMQVRDTCGGFATFASVAITRGTDGAPRFTTRVGGATVKGQWLSATRIRGKVQTPCASRQDYVMHLVH